MHTVLYPSTDFRRLLRKRGGASVSRCFQCATCSSVCDLVANGSMFPRPQMIKAQWGLEEQLAGDAGVWLCHQCNDCSTRCPRDAKPGDVLGVVRALTIERLAAPAFVGHLVGNAAKTWPILLGVPILFWIVLLAATFGLNFQSTEIMHGISDKGRLVYEHVVPHKLIYGVYFTVAALVLIGISISAGRFWRKLGQGVKRSGSWVTHLGPVLADVGNHKRFGSCTTAASRKWGHLALMWGFVGAALTSALLIWAMYGMKTPLPLEQGHPFKILGNISALLLVFGGLSLVLNRIRDHRTSGATTAFDAFFLSVVVLVIATGVLTELGAFVFAPQLAGWIYVVHLGATLSLFITFPYSKFAHMLYRTMAMLHERMVSVAGH